MVEGELEVRPDRFQAYVGGESVELTRREFELLQALADHGGKVLERDEIYQRVWGYAMIHGDRSVDVFVRKLRFKLQKRSPGWEYIHTHFGIGYRFDPQPRVPREDAPRHRPANPREGCRSKAGSPWKKGAERGFKFQRGGRDKRPPSAARRGPRVYGFFTSWCYGSVTGRSRCLAVRLGPRQSPGKKESRSSDFTQVDACLFVGGAGIAAGLGACGSDDDSGGSEAYTSAGAIKMDGSSTVQPFAEAAAELFNEDNPDVSTRVGAAGTKRRIREVLRRRDRHLERLAADRAGGD